MIDIERIGRQGDIVLRSTAPIYRRDQRDRLDLFGSGVFVRHEAQHFIVSAAHVLAELRERELWIGGEGQVIALATGRFFHTGQPGQVNFDDDAFDVAFAPLTEQQVTELNQPAFISTSEIDRDPTTGRRYNVVGFISKDYKQVGPMQPVTVEATTLAATPAPQEKYVERGVTDESHLLLSFDRLRTYSEQGPAATPKIVGMSGCGVWRARDTTNALSAILTEHHQQHGKFIVSTRLTALIQGLAAYAGGDLQ